MRQAVAHADGHGRGGSPLPPERLICPSFSQFDIRNRKQVEPDEHIGVINLLPVVQALGDGRTLNIIEELLPGDFRPSQPAALPTIDPLPVIG